MSAVRGLDAPVYRSKWFNGKFLVEGEWVGVARILQWTTSLQEMPYTWTLKVDSFVHPRGKLPGRIRAESSEHRFFLDVPLSID